MNIRIRRVGQHDLQLPAYAREGDAGLDLRANINGLPAKSEGCVGFGDGELTLFGASRAIIPCGFAFEIPPGFEGQVRPRSGMSFGGLVVILGTVDSNYRGEVSVLIWNMSGEARSIRAGYRLAQFVIAPCVRADLVEVDELTETSRGANGFGSSGVA